MRSNLENNKGRQLHLLATTYGSIEATLTSSFVVADDGPIFHFLNGGASDRTIFLPEIPPQGGLLYLICNTGTTNALDVVDDDGNAVATVDAESVGMYFSSFTEWKGMLGVTVAEMEFLNALKSEPTVVAADHVVTASETTIAIQKAAPVATAITLPTVASRDGKPVSIVDWSSAVVGHTITITPNGLETIMGQATWTLFSNAANLASVTLWPSTTLGGWYIKP